MRTTCPPTVEYVSSSLVYAVVAALWLAYLVPAWLRRRQRHRAGRAVDRYSSAVRALAAAEGRDRASRPDPASRALMPGAEAPRRTSVKRAERVALEAWDLSRTGREWQAARDAELEAYRRAAELARCAAAAEAADDAGRTGDEHHEQEEAGMAEDRTQGTGHATGGRGARAGRRVLGLGVLLLVPVTVVLLVLLVLGAVSWAWPGAAVALLAADLRAVQLQARRRRAARRAARERARREAGEQTQADQVPGAGAVAAAALSGEVVEPEAEVEDVPFDIEADPGSVVVSSTAQDEPVAPAASEQPFSGAPWTPHEVPLPTYVTAARVERETRESAGVAEGVEGSQDEAFDPGEAPSTGDAERAPGDLGDVLPPEGAAQDGDSASDTAEHAGDQQRLLDDVLSRRREVG